MMHPDLLNEEGKRRHQELIHAAEQRRLQQRVQGKRTPVPGRLRLRLGERLIAWGLQLKASAPPAPQPE